MTAMLISTLLIQSRSRQSRTNHPAFISMPLFARIFFNFIWRINVDVHAASFVKYALVAALFTWLTTGCQQMENRGSVATSTKSLVAANVDRPPVFRTAI